MKLHHLTLAAMTLTLGCGGSAVAELRLYDAAPAGVTAVNIFVKSMDVHVDDLSKTESTDPATPGLDDDGKWETLEVNQSIDLLQHQGETAAMVLGQLTLPTGKITQLRLVIDTTQPNTATLTDGSACNLDTSAVETRGIKINHVFKAFQAKQGETEQVFVHFDLDNSLTATATCFALSPRIELTKVVEHGHSVGIN